VSQHINAQLEGRRWKFFVEKIKGGSHSTINDDEA
jgi:hypothetical protein